MNYIELKNYVEVGFMKFEEQESIDDSSKETVLKPEIEEYEAVTDSFTADNENFEKVFEKTFYPHIDNTDGFYICKMKRIK